MTLICENVGNCWLSRVLFWNIWFTFYD